MVKKINTWIKIMCINLIFEIYNNLQVVPFLSVSCWLKCFARSPHGRWITSKKWLTTLLFLSRCCPWCWCVRHLRARSASQWLTMWTTRLLSERGGGGMREFRNWGVCSYPSFKTWRTIDASVLYIFVSLLLVPVFSKLDYFVFYLTRGGSNVCVPACREGRMCLAPQVYVTTSQC